MPNKHSLNYYRCALLIPYGVALLIMALIFFISTYARDQSHQEAQLKHMPAALERSMRVNIEQNADKLESLLKVLVSNEGFQSAFAQRDRATLLRASEGLFAQLKTGHEVTHWYFMTPDRQIFLRVHQPDRFGDVAERKTAIDAQRMAKVASGVELGVRGTFTLRVVLPWLDAQQKLLGYMELGMEVDRSLSNLQELAGLNVFMLIEKQHLNRVRWEEGMRALGHQPNWQQLPNYVVAAKTASVSVDLLRHTRFASPMQQAASFDVEDQQRRLHFDEQVLFDVAGNAVGRWVLVSDTTREHRATQQFMLRVLGALLLFGVSSLFLAKYIVDRVYTRLSQTEEERDEFKIKSQLDGLTGLANQVAFYRWLDQSVQSCCQQGGNLVVLMVDVDYFKKINDQYGHQAGDEVLRRVANLLQECVRPSDIAARYGGEEFAMALCPMHLEEALLVAERVRTCVEGYLFVAAGHTLRVTVSIGVAAFPQHAAASEALVAEADQALYAAKRAGRNCVRCVVSGAASLAD